MKKLLSLVAISFMLLGIGSVQARNSAASYDNRYWSQQEFVQAYNSSTASMYRDYIVGIDTAVVGATGIVNPNYSLGQYVTEATSSTTDNTYVFGVVDETIPAGQLGRICIRGPHKVVLASNTSQAYWGVGAVNVTAGALISQCKNNSPQVPNTVGYPNTPVNGGVGCQFTTATGTTAGTLGYILSATATTDTGDVGTATNAQNQGTSTNNEYWAWISPQILR